MCGSPLFFESPKFFSYATMRAGWIRIITLSSLVIWAVQNKNYLNSSWKMNGNLKTPHLDHPCYFKGCCQSVYCNFLFLTPAALPDTSLFSCDEDNFFLQVSPFFPSSLAIEVFSKTIIFYDETLAPIPIFAVAFLLRLLLFAGTTIQKERPLVVLLLSWVIAT